MIRILLVAVGFLSCVDSPEPLKKPFKVLLLGDSISIGYTNHVREIMGSQAIVFRPTYRNSGKPENCEGTTKGKDHIDRWLSSEDGAFDIVHFNFGLHDLKRINVETKKGSNNPEDPQQAALAVYIAQLRTLTAQMVASGAQLIFATTTPVPDGGVKPHRDPDDVVRYNKAAKTLMGEFGIPVNDLYELAIPQLKDIQHPVNVHFTEDGSRVLAQAVAKAIFMAAGTLDASN